VSDKDKRFCSNSCYKASVPETKIETIVREYLKQLGILHELQKQFGRYVCDFVIPEKHIIIETDGDYWHSTRLDIAERDKKRDKYLEGLGYSVVRLTETDIMSGEFKNRLTCLN